MRSIRLHFEGLFRLWEGGVRKACTGNDGILLDFRDGLGGMGPDPLVFEAKEEGWDRRFTDVSEGFAGVLTDQLVFVLGGLVEGRDRIRVSDDPKGDGRFHPGNGAGVA